MWGYLFPGSDDDPDLRLARSAAMLRLAQNMWDPRSGQFQLNNIGGSFGDALLSYKSAEAQYRERQKKLDEEKAALERANAIRAKLSTERYGSMDPELLKALPDDRMVSVWAEADRQRVNRLDEQVEGARRRSAAETQAREQQEALEWKAAEKQASDHAEREQLMSRIPERAREQLRDAPTATLKAIAARIDKEVVFPPKPAGAGRAAAKPKPAPIDKVDPESVFFAFSDELGKAEAEVGEGGVAYPGDMVLRAAVTATKGISDPAAREATRKSLLALGQLRTETGEVDRDRIRSEGLSIVRGGFDAGRGGYRVNEEVALQSKIAKTYAETLAAKRNLPLSPEIERAVLEIVMQGGAELEKLKAELGIR